MPVVTINELKARGQSGDRITNRDWVDLIDTLFAGAAGLPPTGAASGALAGNYPAPIIKTDASVDGNRPVDTDSIKNSAVKLRHFNATEASGSGAGAILTYNGAAVVWAGASAGSSGTTVNVSGAVKGYTSSLIAPPAADGSPAGFPIALPSDFGAAPPNLVRWVAVCKTGIFGYSVGDEVEMDQFVLLADPDIRVFSPSVSRAAGVNYLNMRVEYGAIGSSTGAAVYDRTVTTAPPIANSLMPFSSVGQLQTAFDLRAYVHRFEGGTGFGSIAAYNPATIAMPATATTTDFAHGFGELPAFAPKVTLVNSVTELGYVPGDEVNLHASYTTAADGIPAFQVITNTTNVSIRREAATIYIANKTGGTVAAINTANWQIRVQAYRTVNIQTNVFPSLSYEMSRPFGGICAGTDLFAFHYNRNAAISFLSKINLTNNAVTFLRSFNPYQTNCNASLFRFPVANKDRMVWSDSSGVHAIDLSNPATYVTWSTTPFGGYKPVFFDEGGTGGASFPDIYLVASSYDGVYNTNNVIMVKLIRSGGSYTQTNLTTVNFLTGFANIAALNNYLSTGNELYHFSYNPVKRRIYIVEGGIGMMLVYKFNGGLGGGLSIADWWVGTPDKTKLDFEKIIAIPGAAGRWYDTSTDLYAVEYDLANGQEKSITISRTGATDQTGNITRIPWVE